VEPPDTLEKGVRFGCGFFFGFLVAISSSVFFFSRSRSIIASCVLIGLVCGFAALRFGDAFWIWLSKWWSAPWW
jgi:hypothetical protein